MVGPGVQNCCKNSTNTEATLRNHFGLRLLGTSTQYPSCGDCRNLALLVNHTFAHHGFHRSARVHRCRTPWIEEQQGQVQDHARSDANAYENDDAYDVRLCISNCRYQRRQVIRP